MAGSQVVFQGYHGIIMCILARLANLLQQPINNLLATRAATPRFLALRLLHPTFRPRTGSRIFEWLKAILACIFVGHNLVPKVPKWCNTMSPEFIKKLLETCIALDWMVCYEGMAETWNIFKTGHLHLCMGSNTNWPRVSGWSCISVMLHFASTISEEHVPIDIL